MTDYSITELNISYQGLVNLPDDIDKYTNLKILDCSENKLTSLDNLPQTLKNLYCGYNEITSLDNLPPTLEILICVCNKITSLDNLPPSLEYLSCVNNPFTYNFKPSLENIRNYNASRMLSS